MIRRIENLRAAAEPSGSKRCKHSLTEELGFKQDVKFLRCKSCSYVLVFQGGLGWAIPPAVSAS